MQIKLTKIKSNNPKTVGNNRYTQKRTQNSYVHSLQHRDYLCNVKHSYLEN